MFLAFSKDIIIIIESAIYSPFQTLPFDLWHAIITIKNKEKIRVLHYSKFVYSVSAPNFFKKQDLKKVRWLVYIALIKL